MSTPIERRKADHLDLCATDAVGFRGVSTLLECVRLQHDSLPELAVDEVDTSSTVFGKRLRMPFLVAGMTGGHDRAAAINRGLAAVCEARGYAFGVGSQRAMFEQPALAATYAVRDVAPTALLFGNVGVVQARGMSTADVLSLVRALDADALCVHLNPAQELVQHGGDCDFRGCLDTLRRLGAELPVPVIPKETGAGISAPTAARLRDAGLTWVDVGGAGGTSWVGVEALRGEGVLARVGEALWDWGVPTAASVHHAAAAGLCPIATGGIGDGVAAARAIALGARLCGFARAAFRAFVDGGEPAVHALFDVAEAELRAVMVLTGSRDLEALRKAPRVLVGELPAWL